MSRRLITQIKYSILKTLNVPAKYLVSKYLETDFYVPINKTEVNDIFIVGYPKSGNTWMQSLVAGIQYGINTEYLPFSLANELVPDVHARKYYKRFNDVTFFKTHHLPKKEYKKVIYLIRDGRDVMTSYYFMNQNLGKNHTMKDMFIDGKGVFPSKWHEHVEQWLKNPFNSEIIYIKYEDLLINPINELEKICAFANINRTADQLKEINSGNSFDSMKRKAELYKRMGHANWEGEHVSNFFREGKFGGHKDLVPKDILILFEAQSHNCLIKFNYNR